LITHKLDEIKEIADRCAVLCKGKLVGVLPVATTTTNEMSALMVGHDVSDTIVKTEYTAGEEVLKVENLQVVSNQNVTLVDNVSFAVHRGEILAIAGVAGNGQVEIADAVAGLIPITKGSILLGGNDISHDSVRKRIESGISYIPEDRHSVGLILDLSLRENLCLKQYYQQPYCKPNGILDFSNMEKAGTKLIADFDIRCSRGDDTIVRSMSGGNQQKAIIAREIQLNSQLLMFVQPTRGLDVGAIEAIHERINTLRSEGKAILLISLELDEVMKLADTILVMYNGQIQTTRKATELTKLQVGEYMMGVHVEKK
jgi:simple sugar transport system ATP-binding protein